MCQAPGPQARFPAHEFVRGEVAEGAVGPIGVAVVDPAGVHDPGLGERVGQLTILALIPEAVVKGLNVAVLQGRTRVDVVGADAAVGQAVVESRNTGNDTPAAKSANACSMCARCTEEKSISS